MVFRITVRSSSVRMAPGNSELGGTRRKGTARASLCKLTDEEQHSQNAGQAPLCTLCQQEPLLPAEGHANDVVFRPLVKRGLATPCPLASPPPNASTLFLRNSIAVCGSLGVSQTAENERCERYATQFKIFIDNFSIRVGQQRAGVISLVSFSRNDDWLSCPFNFKVRRANDKLQFTVRKSEDHREIPQIVMLYGYLATRAYLRAPWDHDDLTCHVQLRFQYMSWHTDRDVITGSHLLSTDWLSVAFHSLLGKATTCFFHPIRRQDSECSLNSALATAISHPGKVAMRSLSRWWRIFKLTATTFVLYDSHHLAITEGFETSLPFAMKIASLLGIHESSTRPLAFSAADIRTTGAVNRTSPGHFEYPRGPVKSDSRHYMTRRWRVQNWRKRDSKTGREEEYGTR
ncbi:hypothetical protein IW261DRAFT_1590543 [Armillaria novae-zelandiae]|uniref:Uncharacterized protein n=1 Tax=Armillaria novae-zelandiae TaxID=153914 RepID=A0AA39UEH6_9AGAR|nr:hypothetical protein IW261DRAFT_1590543 [Armillaria novae-zelandiae]